MIILSKKGKRIKRNKTILKEYKGIKTLDLREGS